MAEVISPCIQSLGHQPDSLSPSSFPSPILLHQCCALQFEITVPLTINCLVYTVKLGYMKQIKPKTTVVFQESLLSKTAQ